MRRPRTPTTTTTDPSGDDATPPGWAGAATTRLDPSASRMVTVSANSSPTKTRPPAAGAASWGWRPTGVAADTVPSGSVTR